MEYCFTTNINIWETFKGWTPYIMGIVVYLIWHKQKGKEVIANEAKTLILDIIEVQNMLNKLSHSYKNINEYNENLNKLINMNIVLKDKLELLLTLININRNDKKYEDMSDSFIFESGKLSINLYYKEDIESFIEILKISKNYNDSLNNLKNHLALYTLFKF